MSDEKPSSTRRARDWAYGRIEKMSSRALAIVVLLAIAVFLLGGVLLFLGGEHFAHQQDQIRSTQVSNAPAVAQAARDAAAAKAAGDKAVNFIDGFSMLVNGIKIGLSNGQQQILSGNSISQWNTYRICVAVGATGCVAPVGPPP